MPIFEVTRTVRETQVIRAADEDDAKRLMSTYAADEINATCVEVHALPLPHDTPVPTELPATRKKAVIITGDPLEGFKIIGPFPTEDDALEHLATDETFQHYNGWVTDLHPPRVERP